MKVKKKFICQINQDSILLASWRLSKDKVKDAKVEVEPIDFGSDDASISEKLKKLFKKLGLGRESIIISLPRAQATCRYLKFPSCDPAQIEKMAPFHAGRFLPYSIDELITGYSLISSDSEGYSYLNFIIVHQDVIQRILGFLKHRRVQVEAIILSSYVLAYWYRHITKTQSERHPTMIISFDAINIEFVIVFDNNLLFSRALRMSSDGEQFKQRLIEEITRTLKSYQRETQQPYPEKVIITASSEVVLEKARNLELSLAIEYIVAQPLIEFTQEQIEGCLNLLPPTVKGTKTRLLQRKQQIKVGVLLVAIITFLISGIFVGFHHKAKYAAKLKEESKKNSKLIQKIEDMKSKTQIINAQIRQSPKAIDVIHSVYKYLPEGIHLTTLLYEGNTRLILRGESKILSTILDAVRIFEKSERFSNVKVNFATTKKIQNEEVIDFEIVCPLQK